MKQFKLITIIGLLQLIVNLKSYSQQTTAYIPKYTSGGATINSQMKDNATTVVIGSSIFPTTSPPRLLVDGKVTFNANVSGDGTCRFNIDRTNFTSYEAMISFNTTGTNKWVMGMDNDGTDMFHVFGPGSLSVMNIGTNGNVGLGLVNTAIPDEKLTVGNGNILVKGLTGFNTPNSKAYLYLGNSSYYINSEKTVGIKMGTTTNPDVLCVLESGKVAIGGTSLVSVPGAHKLYVKGGILTDDILVANYGSSQWPDYVFASDYKLNSLSEIKSYIQKNNHLPDVPSAQEIESKGYSLPSMDAALLKKAEELTLLLIQMDDKVKKLETEIAALKGAKSNN